MQCKKFHITIIKKLLYLTIISHFFIVFSTGECDFYTSRETFMAFHYSMIGPKHSPLVPPISKRYVMIRVVVKGILMRK